jgi:hypothetical protein
MCPLMGPAAGDLSRRQSQMISQNGTSCPGGFIWKIRGIFNVTTQRRADGSVRVRSAVHSQRLPTSTGRMEQKGRLTAFRELPPCCVDTSRHRTRRRIGRPYDRADALAQCAREPKIEAGARGFRRIALDAFTFNHVVADFKFAPALDFLPGEPAITDELTPRLQFHCPQAEAEFVVVPEISLNPRFYVCAVRHFGVKPPGIGISEHIEQFGLVRGSVCAEAEPFRLEYFTRHVAD